MIPLFVSLKISLPSTVDIESFKEVKAFFFVNKSLCKKKMLKKNNKLQDNTIVLFVIALYFKILCLYINKSWETKRGKMFGDRKKINVS